MRYYLIVLRAWLCIIAALQARAAAVFILPGTTARIIRFVYYSRQLTLSLSWGRRSCGGIRTGFLQWVEYESAG